MAFLCMPDNQPIQKKEDFIDWVNHYLRGHEKQPYQYNGIDVYAARCALLHTFGAESKSHTDNPEIKKFGYRNGGLHCFNPSINPTLVIIGTGYP
jgi:hypothetical protein